MQVLMPQAVATVWNGSRLLNASLGELAVPAQCGLSPRQRGHKPLAQLPVPLPTWWDITEKEEERGSVFFPRHPLWTSSTSLRQRLFLSQGLESKTSLHHTCRHSYFPCALLSLPFPLPLCKTSQQWLSSEPEPASYAHAAQGLRIILGSLENGVKIGLFLAQHIEQSSLW